jgi:hypothetical protein
MSYFTGLGVGDSITFDVLGYNVLEIQVEWEEVALSYLFFLHLVFKVINNV